MLGFEYIKNWESIFHPFLTTLFGVISYLSILAIGRIEIKLLKNKDFKNLGFKCKNNFGCVYIKFTQSSLGILEN